MMSVNTAESEDAQLVAYKSANELIYRLGDCPSLLQTLFAAFQHLLVMFVVVITLALLIYQALGLPVQDTQHIINMPLFTSGTVSIIQIRAWGPVGSGLLSIQGTSFSSVVPLIIGGTVLKTGDADVPTMMTALFDTLMPTNCTEMVFSRILHLACHIITPSISSVVVMVISLSLIRVGPTFVDGGYAAVVDYTFGTPKDLLLVGIVLALITILNRQRNPYLRTVSLVIATVTDYLVTWFLDMLPANTAPTNDNLITIPAPLYYGLGINRSLLLPLTLVFMVTSLETIGDITATPDALKQPVSDPLHMEHLKGVVLANDLNSFVPAVLNTFPNSCFGQNNGVIQLTGVASRYVGFVVALMLTVLGLFPAVSGFVQYTPEPVLGGVTLVTLGTIAASDVCIVSREPLNCRTILIIAPSLAVSLGVPQQPLILQFAPDWLKDLLSSGVAASGITTIILNLIFPPEKA